MLTKFTAALVASLITAQAFAVEPAGAQQSFPTFANRLPEPISTEALLRGDYQPVTKQILLAHHGGDASTASLGAVDVLATQPGGNAEFLSDSIWGNLILQMAYARDPQLNRSSKKLRLTNNLTLAGIYAISGLSLAQGITSLGTLNQGHGTNLEVVNVSNTVPAHEHAEELGEAAEGAHEHSHASSASSATATDHGHEGGHRDSAAPAILGIVASGSTLVTLGMRWYFNQRFSKQLRRRQFAIKAQVESILARLEQGASVDSLRSELIPLIGERACREFSSLWKAGHGAA